MYSFDLVKSKKKPKIYLNIVRDKKFQFFGKICKFNAMECFILFYSINSKFSWVY